jgi:hypothetical protein
VAKRYDDIRQQRRGALLAAALVVNSAAVTAWTKIASIAAADPTRKFVIGLALPYGRR